MIYTISITDMIVRSYDGLMRYVLVTIILETGPYWSVAKYGRNFTKFIIST